MKKVIEFIVFQAAAFLIGWIIYIGILNFGLFDFIEIYFYRSIVILIVTGLIMLAAELLLKRYWKNAVFDYKDIIMSFVLIMSINMVWLSSAVVSLDRSLSVFVLSYLAEEDRAYSQEELNQVFEEVFIEKYEMLDRRFWEQIETGNIKADEEGNYYLTARGKWFADTFKAVGRLYNVDKRFIEPEIIVQKKIQ